MRFANDRTRVLVRPTAHYSMLLISLHNPELLTGGVKTDFHLDRFLTKTGQWDSAPRICAAERADLWSADIPSFYSQVGSRDLWTSVGERVEDFFRNERLRDRTTSDTGPRSGAH